MKNITEIRSGLPKDKVRVKPLLEQYNISMPNDNGTLVFPDGMIYITTANNEKGEYQWKYFTRLKSEGITLLEKLIEFDFYLIKNEDLPETTSQNILIWKSFFKEESKEVKVASGLYTNLPPVFQKIDNLINQFMYKMNEQIQD